MTLDPRRPGRAILPLPADVVAQIKSSTAIVSLTGVVLELLKNSLDAQATRVEATVDFARGACTVEDDGLGIAPLDFTEDGGLGKLHHSSKHDAHEALLGRNGTFLASLSAVSLLSITSRHHQHRSHNSVTFHHASTIERQLPASAHTHVHGKHGTRVTVRNLFGNLPVRVKQRSRLLEQRPENDRLWSSTKTSVTGLLLSWGGCVSLRVRDANNHVVFSFHTSDAKQTARLAHAAHHVDNGPSTRLFHMLAVLTQASCISVDGWPSWVPVSASTSTLSIRGAISLNPAPTKSIQFISFGVRPLLAEVEYIELYNQVNRLFRLSSFGTVEDDAGVHHLDKIRRPLDKRSIMDGHTNRQLKARKGVDKYPMFHLRISLRKESGSGLHDDRFVEDQTNLQTIVEVLEAMITQWLSMYHFRPTTPRQQQQQSDGLNARWPPRTTHESPSPSEIILHQRLVSTPTSAAQPRSGHTSRDNTKKRKRSAPATSMESIKPSHRRPFAKWSRIKTGKAGFFDTFAALRKPPEKTTMPLAASGGTGNAETPVSQLVPAAAAGFVTQPAVQRDNQPKQGFEPSTTHNERIDNTIRWTDPMTKKAYLLNARTGYVVPHASLGPGSRAIASSSAVPRLDSAKSVRLSTAGTRLEDTPWLDTMLKDWDNPVFRNTEKHIEQILPRDPGFDEKHSRHANSRGFHLDFDKDSTRVSSKTSSRISRESLSHAEIIAQVDKKFILVKLISSVGMKQLRPDKAASLILIDQHAADERVHVENLYQQLCAPRIPGRHGYKSSLGHEAQVNSTVLNQPLLFTISKQERRHFVAHAARFAAWGILFDLVDTAQCSERAEVVLSVVSLPPVILERCRADPFLLISLLRSTVWKYVGDPYLPPYPSTTDASSPDWVTRLLTCPKSLLDLIHSRACRSSIMFNDEIDVRQCKQLLQKLAACKFPFICAHGRPSMVPLADPGFIGNDTTCLDSEPGPGCSFVQAWMSWKR